LRLIPPFGDVKMLLRIAAWCAAAFLVAMPASASIEIGMAPHADVPAAAIAIDAPDGVMNAAANDTMAATHDAVQAESDAKAEDDQPQTAVAAPVQADSPTTDQVATQAAIQPEIVTQDRKAADAPTTKLAALEPTAPDLPRAAVSPRAELPTNNLPRIDTAFRFNVLPVNGGDVLAKWNTILAALRTERDVFAGCRANADTCPVAAKRFLAIVDQGRALIGRARIGVINRAVNMAIEPVSDMAQWGVDDRWSPPLETFATRKGDCEDYAIAKYAALVEAGFAAADVKLMIVQNTAAHEEHAVTAVRLDGAWIILDNRWLKLVEDTAMVQAIPLFALGDEGVRQFLPDVLIGERRTPPAPASIAD
jgi:predicted transglutaminase-like cysteine proteinase